MNNLEFARELHKTFMTLGQDVSPTLVLQIRMASSGHNDFLVTVCVCVFILSLAPKGCKEVCTAGAAAKRGGGAEEAEECSGIAVHFGPAR